MSWEDQGRQYHAWFGHGSGGDAEAARGRVLSAAEVADVVVRGAQVFLTEPTRGAFERFVEGGGGRLLAEAVPVWSAAAGMDESSFRVRVVGARVGVGVARALQAVGREVQDARGAEGLRAASAALALAVREGGPEWRYGLRSARDQAVHAAAVGRVDGGVGGGAFGVALPVGGASVLPGWVGPVVGRLGGLGPWGLVAAAVLGVGVAGYVFWRIGGGVSPGGGRVDEARPPADPDDEGEGRRPRINSPIAKPLERPGPAQPTGMGSTATEQREGKPIDSAAEPTVDDTQSAKPPTGSLPIDQTPWSGDHRAIKRATRVPADGKVSISPSGEAWSERPDGTWTNHGPVVDFVPSGKPAGRSGSERERRRSKNAGD